MKKINTNHHFSKTQIDAAFTRQGFLCGACGEGFLTELSSGLLKNSFGEIKHAHHILPKMDGGASEINNCVILCQSCHYTSHEGGNYRKGKLLRPSDFPFYAFSERGNE